MTLKPRQLKKQATIKKHLPTPEVPNNAGGLVPVNDSNVVMLTPEIEAFLHEKWAQELVNTANAAKEIERARKKKAVKEAQKNAVPVVENGMGSLRVNVSLYLFEETRSELHYLALDETEKRDEVVKAHDLIIEGINLVFAKYGVTHVAQRPVRKKK